MKFNVYSSDGISRCLAVFARAPRPGKVKTRLHPILESNAADFYAAMLRDVFLTAGKCAENTGAEVSVFYTPDDAFNDEEYSLRPFWQGKKYPQGEGDIGDRMMRCLHQLQDQSSTHVLLIGSDSPDLPAEYLNQAFESLQQNDLVFGPARDGGFYCIGAASAPAYELFENVEWSSSQTLQQVLLNAGRFSLKFSLLPEWDDVDTPDDLLRLNQRLLNNPQSARHTAAWLSQRKIK